MKTLLLVLIPLLLLSGCVHNVPGSRDIGYRYTIPVYDTVHVVKTEYSYTPVHKKSVHRDKAKYKLRNIVRPKPHRYAMNKRPETKKGKMIVPKVHPQYYERNSRHSKRKKDGEAKKRSYR
jgi:hypothetical protein